MNNNKEKEVIIIYDSDEEVKEKEVKETENKEDDILVNRCLECGIDMGPQNPRQLCGKTRCLHEK